MLNSLKPYFHSIGVNFVVDIIEWSEIEFLENPKYLNRYCLIDNTSFVDSDLTNFKIIGSRNFKPQESKDLDNATIFNIINAKIKYPESKIKVFIAIDSCNEEKIISFRNQKLKLIPDSVVKMKKFLENFKPEDIEIISLPQLPNEIKDE